ncbi:MAG: YbaB/EbfC family nucleoid-associated protein [Clostridiales bacterium]|nr:YbaB/EbfC family nucleoid-associated protein [Clostridiales bacterium]
MARGGMGNIQQLMQQAQRMQQQMAQKQAELAEKTVTAQSGGGMVTATVNGAHELLELSIDPDVIDPEDKEMLEDMVVAAVNQAMQQAEEMAQQELGKLAGGMNIPGLR